MKINQSYFIWYPQANDYDGLPANFRRTALRDHSFWLVVTQLPSNETEFTESSNILDNVCVLNLNVSTDDSVTVCSL